MAIARNYFKTTGLDAVCMPAFVTVAIGDNERTGISLVVARRPLVPTEVAASAEVETAEIPSVEIPGADAPLIWGPHEVGGAEPGAERL